MTLTTVACGPADSPALDPSPQESPAADHSVASTPDNVSWGWFPVDKEPVARVQPGETVLIQTLTHVGATQNDPPVELITSWGVPEEDIPPDLVAFWESRDGRPREGRSGHVITGPVYVEGAEPGDALVIEILDVEPRVSWGANNTSPRGGVFSASYPGYDETVPALNMEPERHVIRTGEVDGQDVAFFSEDIHVPLEPFFGILAVAPDPVVGQPGVTVPGVQSSRPPGAFGGNMDVKQLTAGTTVYLPVLAPGRPVLRR